jgi:hypothetical protein
LGVKDDDTVMVSDLDEVPHPKLIGRMGAVWMNSYYYRFNLLTKEPIIGTVMFPWWWWQQQPSIQWVREHRYQLNPQLQGGWHMSWQGDLETLDRKLSNTMHSEFDTMEFHEKLAYHYEQREDPFGRWPGKFEKVPVAHMPRTVQENLEYWTAKGYIEE